MLIAVLLAILLYCMMCASGIRCAARGRLQRVREIVVILGSCDLLVITFFGTSHEVFLCVNYSRNCPHFFIVVPYGSV